MIVKRFVIGVAVVPVFFDVESEDELYLDRLTPLSAHNVRDLLVTPSFYQDREEAEKYAEKLATS